MDIDDIKDGIHLNLNIDELVPLKLSIPTNDEIGISDRIGLYVTDEQGIRTSRIHISNNTKIPKGIYNFESKFAVENRGYLLFKERVSISRENSTLEFTEEELALLDLESTYSSPVNYEDSIMSTGKIGFYSEYYNTAIKNINSFYITKEQYDYLKLRSIFSKDERYWEYDIIISDGIDIQNDTKLQINDNFGVVVEWKDENTMIDIDKPLSQYIKDSYIKNDLGQRVDAIYEQQRNSNNFVVSRTTINSTVIVKINGKENSKEIRGFFVHSFFDTSIKDIIGDAEISGDVTLEIRIDSVPIDIKPYITTIKI